MRADQLDVLDLAFPLTLRPNGQTSDAELIRFSERNRLFRIERTKQGELTVMTPVGGIGGWNEQYVSRIFSTWVEQDGTGIDFSPNTGFHLPDGSCLSPDAAWLPLAKWNALTPEQQASFPPLCPEFLIEVRSRSDARRLLETKMQLWLENGAQLAWLIDPLDATVSIYRPGIPPQILERPDNPIADAPVKGFELRTSRLWPAKT